MLGEGYALGVWRLAGRQWRRERRRRSGGGRGIKQGRGSTGVGGGRLRRRRKPPEQDGGGGRRGHLVGGRDLFVYKDSGVLVSEEEDSRNKIT
jgi:hypothetical protein